LLEVKYTAYLEDQGNEGQAFEQSDEKGSKFKLGKGKVLKAWDEGITGLKKGGRKYIVAPAEKAYGSKGNQEEALRRGRITKTKYIFFYFYRRKWPSRSQPARLFRDHPQPRKV